MDADWKGVLADFRAAVDQYESLDFTGLTDQELRTLLKREHEIELKLLALERDVINRLRKASPEQLGGKLPDIMASRLRITRDEAVRRILDAKAHEKRTTSRVV